MFRGELVLTLQTFSDEEEAARPANDTRFGPAAIVATGDPERVRDLQAPFGGSRHRPSGPGDRAQASPGASDGASHEPKPSCANRGSGDDWLQRA
ncbi:hypothetical protein OG426_51350 [Streptomyces canus]|uniref:hypothetical protein n=1 Tax=Streptomyces canus TaxID=58343 RepID=UPI00386D7E93|nr:hypothetical protein OG426_51350 [Streptomyces canus]